MKPVYWILLIFLTLLSLAAEFTAGQDPSHAEHWWSGIPAFYILFGFIGCVAIIVISKTLGKIFLQKREDYYDAE